MFEQRGPSFVSKESKEIFLSSDDLISLLKATLDKGSCCRFVVKGFSMHPFIKSKDVLTISPVGNKRLAIGDVVAFISERPKQLIVHRIVKVTDDFYMVKGDNSLCSDGLIPKEDILGYVVKQKRSGKDVCFGLGSEKYVIAFISFYTHFFVVLSFFLKIIRFIVRKFKNA